MPGSGSGPRFLFRGLLPVASEVHCFARCEAGLLRDGSSEERVQRPA